MNTKCKYLLEDRDWLMAQGSDSLRFLNGMWTADLNRAAKTEGRVSGGALLLTPKGKPVSPAIFVKNQTNSFLFSVPAGCGESTQRALEGLLVADDVELKLLKSPEQTPFSSVIGFPLGPPPTLKLQENEWLKHSIPGAQDLLAPVLETPEGLWIKRGKLSKDHVELWVNRGQNFPLSDFRPLNSEELFNLRFENGVPQWGLDWNPESLPLEFPVQDVISLHKGCYVGQEVIARGTFRGKMVRSFCKISNQGSSNLKTDFIYIEGQAEPPVGKITSCLGLRALGVVRLSALGSGHNLFQKSSDGSKMDIGPLVVEPIEGIKAP